MRPCEHRESCPEVVVVALLEEIGSSHVGVGNWRVVSLAKEGKVAILHECHVIACHDAHRLEFHDRSKGRIEVKR